MQTYLSYTFGIDDKDCLSVTRHTNHVSLMSSGAGSDEFNVEFRPCHLDDLREVILELEALEVMQRLEEQQTQWKKKQTEAKESGVPA